MSVPAPRPGCRTWLTPLGWAVLVVLLLSLGFVLALWWNPAPTEPAARRAPRLRPIPTRGLEVLREPCCFVEHARLRVNV